MSVTENTCASNEGIVSDAVTRLGRGVGYDDSPAQIDIKWAAFGASRSTKQSESIIVNGKTTLKDLKEKKFFKDLLHHGPLSIENVEFKAQNIDKPYVFHDKLNKEIAKEVLSFSSKNPSLVMVLAVSMKTLKDEKAKSMFLEKIGEIATGMNMQLDLIRIVNNPEMTPPHSTESNLKHALSRIFSDPFGNLDNPNMIQAGYIEQADKQKLDASNQYVSATIYDPSCGCFRKVRTARLDDGRLYYTFEGESSSSKEMNPNYLIPLNEEEWGSVSSGLFPSTTRRVQVTEGVDSPESSTSSKSEVVTKQSYSTTQSKPVANNEKYVAEEEDDFSCVLL